MRTSLS